MAKDNLDQLEGKINEKIDNDGIDKSSQKPVMVHKGYYQLVKLYCALHSESIINVADKAFQKLLDDGFFDDVKNLTKK